MYKIEVVENKAKKFKIFKDALTWNEDTLIDDINYDEINCFDYIMVASYVDQILSSIAMIKEENSNVLAYIIANSNYKNDKVMIRELEFILKLIRKELKSRKVKVKLLNSSDLIIQGLKDKKFNSYVDDNKVTYVKRLKD